MQLQENLIAFIIVLINIIKNKNNKYGICNVQMIQMKIIIKNKMMIK